MKCINKVAVLRTGVLSVLSVLSLFCIFSSNLLANVNPDGSFSHSIPITIPKGAMNTAPNLSLEYNSNRENGMLGMGWELAGLSYITRVNYGNGITYTASDTYLHSDIGVLVNTGSSIYHSKKESFTKLVPSGTCGVGPCSWTATDRSGVKFYYGTTTDSRIEAVGKGGSVRVWALSKVEDLHGNYYEVAYSEDTANSDYYPTLITYTKGNGITTYRTVELSYEARTDVEQGYSQSAVEQWNQRLKWITVKSAGTFIRKYRLDYQYGTSNRSRLTTVQEYGSDGTSTLPAITFGWQNGGSPLASRTDYQLGQTVDGYMRILEGDFDGDGMTDYLHVRSGWGTAQLYISTGAGFTKYEVTHPANAVPGTVVDGSTMLLAGDYNGDGKTDVLHFRHAWTSMQWYISTGTNLTRQTDVTTAAYGVDHFSRHLIGDFNGDGKTDYFHARNGWSTAQLHIATGTGFTKYEVLHPAQTFINNFMTYLTLMLTGDFNGDGKTDILFYFNGWTAGWMYYSSGTNFVRQADFPTGAYGVDEFSRHLTGDFNGDGKTDYFHARKGWPTAQLHIATGAGFTKYEVAHPAEGVIINNFMNAQTLLLGGDYNGDGKTDIVHFRHAGTTARLFLSSGTGLIRQADFATRAYGVDGNSIHTTGDFNGDGITDWWHMRSGWGDLQVHQASPSLYPDLLTSVANGLGGTTTVEYTPASQVAGAINPASTQPGAADSSARMLVTGITKSDGRGKSFSTSFQYSDGRYYPGTIPDRESLGFRYVKAIQDQTGEATTTYYYQNKPYNTQIQEERHLAGNGSYTKRVLYNYDSVTPYIGTELVRNTTVTTHAYNLGTLESTTTVTLGYDSYGNVITKTQTATDMPTMYVNMDYLNDTTAWILGRVSEVEILQGSTSKSRVQYAYGNDDLISKTEWRTATESYTTTMTYDAVGNLLTSTDPLSKVTTNTYDSAYKAQITQIANHLGQTKKFTYDIYGLTATEVDENNNTTTTSRDVFGRVSSVTKPDTGVTTVTYVSFGSPSAQYTQTQVSSGSQTLVKKEYFDGMGFVYKMTRTGDSGLITVVKSKDAAGRDYQTSLPYYSGDTVKYTTVQYDTASRKNKITAPDGSITTISYGTGTMTVTDAKGHATTKTYNALGKVTAVTDALNNTTYYNYDGLNRITSINHPNSTTTSIAYDMLNNKTSITEPNTGTTTYYYNGVGNVTRTVDSRAKNIYYTYDNLHRLIKKDLPTGEVDATYTYDETGIANAKGRLTTKVDEAGTWKFSYDTLGNVKTKKLTIEGVNYTMTYTYDLLGRLTTVGLPNGSQATYTYTAGSNLSQVKLGGVVMSTWSAYNAEDKPGKITYGNSVYTDYTYGPLGKITSLVTQKSTTVLQNLSYVFDSVGQVTGMTDNRSSKLVSGINTDETQTFTYDVLDRLTTAVGVYGTRNYAYSAVGNMTSMAGRTLNYTNNKPTSGTNFAASYDASGNMTAKTLDGNSYQYVFTTENRLASVSKSSVLVAEMKYDDKGQRVKKIYHKPGTSEVVTTYYIDKMYEVRKSTAGLDRHTINLYGNGHLILSKTLAGPLTTSLNSYQRHMQSASLFGGDVVGSLKNAYHIASARLTTLSVMHSLYKVLFGFFALVMIVGFGVVLYRSRKAEKTGEDANQKTLFTRITSLGLSLIFTFSIVFSGCNFLDNGDDRSPYSDMTSEQIQRALSGDTTSGIPLGTYYYHRNHINSSSVITNESGTEVTRILYLPYGTIDQAHSVGGDNVTQKFTGQEFDEEISLHYYNARYYDSAIGSFLSADTYVPDPADPQSFNRYSYVRNNPINYIDPSGHFFKSIFKAIKSVFKAIVNVVKAVVKAVVHVVKALWKNPIIRAVIIAVVYTALVIVSGGGALTFGQLAMAGLKAAVVAGIMQTPVAQRAIAGIARGLQKLGLSSKIAGFISSLIVSAFVSSGVSRVMMKMSGTEMTEMSKDEARELDKKYEGLGSQDEALGGRQYREILHGEAANDPMTKFYKVTQNGELLGTVARTPIAMFKWMGEFGPVHTAAWVPVSGIGATVNYSNPHAWYGIMGVCHNSSANLLNQVGSGLYSNQGMGSLDWFQYGMTEALYQTNPWMVGSGR